MYEVPSESVVMHNAFLRSIMLTHCRLDTLSCAIQFKAPEEIPNLASSSSSVCQLTFSTVDVGAWPFAEAQVCT